MNNKCFGRGRKRLFAFHVSRHSHPKDIITQYRSLYPKCPVPVGNGTKCIFSQDDLYSCRIETYACCVSNFTLPLMRGLSLAMDCKQAYHQYKMISFEH